MFRAHSFTNTAPAKAGTPYILPSLARGLATLVLTFTLVSAAAASDLSESQRTAIALEALGHLQGIDLEAKPNLKAAVLRLLDRTRGTPQFVQLVKQFHFKDQDAGLLEAA